MKRLFFNILFVLTLQFSTSFAALEQHSNQELFLHELTQQERERIAESYIRAAEVKMQTQVYREDQFRRAKEDSIKQEAMELYNMALAVCPKYHRAILGKIHIMLYSGSEYSVFSPSGALKEIDFILRENIEYRDGSKKEGWDAWKSKNSEESEKLFIGYEINLKKLYATALLESELFKQRSDVRYLYLEEEYMLHPNDYTKRAEYRCLAIRIVADLHESYRKTFYEEFAEKGAHYLNDYYHLGLKFQ